MNSDILLSLKYQQRILTITIRKLNLDSSIQTPILKAAIISFFGYLLKL